MTTSALEVPEGRYVDVEGPVHYVQWDGPSERTFVLLHGLGGSHLNWLCVAPQLARHGRVIVPDLPGFGRSPLAGRRSAMHVGRHLIDGFLRRVATGRVVLGGNSMGGGYAMLQAAFHPETVEGLILASSVFPWAPPTIPSPLVVAGFGAYRVPWLGGWLVRERFRRLDPEMVVRWGLRITTVEPRRVPPDVVNAHVDLVRERQAEAREGADAFLEAARSILWLGARPVLARRVMDAIACPVLVIHGARDRLIPAASALAALDAHPAWSFRILPHVGHAPQLEAPERWLAAVEWWLSDVAEVAAAADAA
jgi:pimeloyl-ACP methyl ester carboxylesterase